MRRPVVIASAVFIAALACAGALAWAVSEEHSKSQPPNVVDHWHAAYEVWICGERQPNFTTWQSGVTTEGDGVIHIHPFQTYEEGSGSSLGKFFEYGGGLLTKTQMRMPGDERLFENGQGCPDGSKAELSVWVNGQQAEDWAGYIPHDGDRITISFAEAGDAAQPPR